MDPPTGMNAAWQPEYRAFPQVGPSLRSRHVFRGQRSISLAITSCWIWLVPS